MKLKQLLLQSLLILGIFTTILSPLTTRAATVPWPGSGAPACFVDDAKRGVLIDHPLVVAAGATPEEKSFPCYVHILLAENMSYVVLIAIVLIVAAGVQYMLSGAGAGDTKKAKQTITGVLGGLIFYFLIRYILPLMAGINSLIVEQPAPHPFAASQRREKIRPFIFGAVAIVLALVGYYFFTRSQQSGLVIVGQGIDEVKISLNGKAVQVKDDPRGIYIPVFAGQYRLQLVVPDHLPFVQDITIIAGQELLVRPVYTLIPKEERTVTSHISFVRPSPDQSRIYFLGDSGSRLFRFTVNDTRSLALTDPLNAPVTDVQWSTNPDVALIVQTNGTFLREIPRYNYQTQTVVKIAGTELESPIWDPNNPERIAAGYNLPNGEHSLILTDKRISEINRKVSLQGFVKPKLIWSPDSRYIAVINNSANTGENNLWLYTLANGDFHSLTTNGQVADASFNPGSTIVLYETVSGSNHTLHSYDIVGAQTNTQTFTGTVSKAAWRSNDSLYLPKDGQASLVLRTLSGTEQEVPYSVPDTLNVRGMYYFESTQTLVFYTENAVYTVHL